VAFGLNVRENFLDLAVAADHERSARNAHHFFSVHVLFFQNTVGNRGFLVDVAQQRERQAVLGFEARLGSRLVGGNAEHHAVLLVELLDGVTKLVSFCGSTGRIGTREEVKYDLLALELGKLERLVGVGPKLDVGSFVAFFEHQSFSNCYRNRSGVNAWPSEAT